MSSTARRFEAPDLIEVMDEAYNYNNYLIKQLTAWSSSFNTILDFGAGNGRFAAALHGSSRSVSAIEPDRELRAKIQLQGVTAYGGLSELRGAAFDGVYSINVLEHIKDDLAILRHMREVLRPGGGLLLYVPAFQLLFSANDRRVGHWRRYRIRPLIALVQNAGFHVTRCEYVDSIGFLAALGYRYWGSTEGDLNIAAVRAYDRYVFPLSRILDRAASSMLGKNLILEAVAASTVASDESLK